MEDSDEERARAFWKVWLERTLEDQDGVVTHAQLKEAGQRHGDIERMLRRKELRRVHPRVYVNHTGPLTWRQRAWAAVLCAAPAALCWTSLTEPPKDDGGPIHVAIDRSRKLRARPGVVLHRVTGLEKRLFPEKPPRLRIEDNALLMADAAETEIDVVAMLANVIGRRGVTARTLMRALARFPRLRRRGWVSDLLEDLVEGTCSVLEHGYLTRVERAHGLPRADRQVPRVTADGREYRDVEYLAYALVVELDGTLGHDSWKAQGRDADRDLDDLALGGKVTARLRWKQVYGTSCRTALRIALILRRRGWVGTPIPCGPDCDVRTWGRETR